MILGGLSVEANLGSLIMSLTIFSVIRTISLDSIPIPETPAIVFDESTSVTAIAVEN